MFVRKKVNANKHIVVQIVENHRRERTTVQTVLRHIGTANSPDQLEKLLSLAETIKTQLEHERLAKKEISTKNGAFASKLGTWRDAHGNKKIAINNLEEKARTVLGFHDIYGSVYDLLGFSNLFARPQQRVHVAHVLKEIVLARIACPTSKRAAVSFLSEHFGVTLNLDHVYQMMDKIDNVFIERVQQCALAMALKLTEHELKIMFYDVTTLYFESFTEDDLKRNGYSKDLKFNQPQVLLALFATEQGLPIGYELFPGNMFEGHTLIPALEKMKRRYQLEKLVVVADRGLLSEANLLALEANNIKYVVGARIKNVSKTLKSQILDEQNYRVFEDENRIAEFNIGGHRKLIVSHTKAREKKDAYDRQKAIDKLFKKLNSSRDPKSLLSNYGYKKYINIIGDAKIGINQARLDTEKCWDGLAGVTTNISDERAEEILNYYRQLWQIEACFRVNKHDLKMRPIYHWTPDRIKSHIAIAFMSFVCVKYLEYRLQVQFKSLSPEVIRQSLFQVQASTLYDKQTGQHFILPSKCEQTAKAIYRVMGIKLPTHAVML